MFGYIPAGAFFIAIPVGGLPIFYAFDLNEPKAQMITLEFIAPYLYH